MVIPSFIVIGCLILGFGLISKWLQKSIFTPPMMFTSVGLLELISKVDLKLLYGAA